MTRSISLLSVWSCGALPCASPAPSAAAALGGSRPGCTGMGACRDPQGSEALPRGLRARGRKKKTWDGASGIGRADRGNVGKEKHARVHVGAAW